MRTGGVLFEHFILSRGSSKDSKVLAASLQEAAQCTEDGNQFYVDSYALKFWHHAVVWMHDVNPKCTAPLGFWDTILEYRGVSRTGRHLNSAIGLSLPLRTYDRFRKKEVKEFTSVVKSIGERNGGVFVCDNFNRNYRLHGLRTDSERPYQSLNLMVNAIQSFPDYLDNPYPFKVTESGNVLPSFPQQMKELKPFWNSVGFIFQYFFFLAIFC